MLFNFFGRYFYLILYFGEFSAESIFYFLVGEKTIINGQADKSEELLKLVQIRVKPRTLRL